MGANMSLVDSRIAHTCQPPTEPGPAFLESARREPAQLGPALRLAETPELRHAALDLVLEYYKRQGYVPPDAVATHVHRYALVPGAETIVACDSDGTVLATLTLVPDGPWGLPMDSLYREELTRLRKEGRVLAECIGFASRVLERHATLRLVVSLTRAAMWFALRSGRTDLVVTVNPRHVHFYARLLPFQIIGAEKQYAAVQNAPAVPLRLNLLTLAEERERRRAAYRNYLGELDLRNLQTTSTFRPPSPGESATDAASDRQEAD